MNKFLKKIKNLFVSVKTFISDRKWLLAKVSAYLIFMIVFYFFFLWLLFPYNELVTKLSDEIKTKTGMNVSVRKAEGAFPLGLDLSDVIITKANGSNETLLLEARTIKIVPGIFSLLKRWFSAKIYARLYNGRAFINIGTNKKDFFANLVIKNIYINKYDLIRKEYGLNIEGILDANLDIKGNLTNVNKDKGNAVIKISHMILHPSKILGILTLPNVDFGDVNIPVYIKDGKVLFQNATQNSKVLNSRIDGDIMLLNPVANSILNIKLKFNPSPDLEQQLKKSIPIFNLTRDASGYYIIPITGSLSMPRFE
ncbi:MAG: type II secretion system protein GspN [bacterium]